MNAKAAFAVTKKFAAVVLTTAMSLSSAHAFMLDTKIGSGNLPNSGNDAELTAIEAASGNSSLVLLSKVTATTGTALLNPGTTDQFYIDVGAQQPLYFAVKFGIGGTSSQQDTFLFQNNEELTKLVFSSSQVNFLSGGDCGASGNGNACNIGRLSHYAIYGSTDNGNGNGNGEVPEPATVALFGLGLLGFAASRRKAAQKRAP